MHYSKLIGVISIAALSLLSGCDDSSKLIVDNGNDDPTRADEIKNDGAAAAALVDSWASSCISAGNDIYIQYNLTITGNDIAIAGTTSDAIDCSNLVSSFSAVAYYDALDVVMTESGLTATNIDIYIESVDGIDIDDLDTSGEELLATIGLDIGAQSSDIGVFYHLFYITNDVLYLGNTAGANDATTSDKRPVDVNIMVDGFSRQ